MPTKSWRPMVRTGTDPKLYGNALRFATREEAEMSALDLSMRWMAVTDTGVEESEDPVNYKRVDGRDVPIESLREVEG